MSTAEIALISGVIAVGLAVLVGWGLYTLLIPNAPLASAHAYGRKWLAWTVALITVVVLPGFFLNLDVESFAAWILAITVFGVIGFSIGWVYGKVFKSFWN